ncbi:beta-ketoacyl-ACP synthase II [Paenibacillus terreus]|uniref:3-oxoacyl-[acyl-carrier-protein] synthase 2 n=1 Tax=Paenibacillus terreus TaxID=1387834 RepID=A0ABV5BAL1_9BACL
MNRVVITGMGIVSPIGNSVESFWGNLVEGKSGISTIESFDASDLDSRIAGEVKDFDAEALWGRKEARSLDRFTQFALAAAEQAYAQSQLQLEKVNHERLGAYVGTAVGGMDTILENVDLLYKRGSKRVSPNLVAKMLSNMAASQISIRFGALGPSLAFVTACASATMAIGAAYKVIQRNDADVMFAGGSEALINQLILASFNNAKALSTRNDTPALASRPFAEDRDGFVISEGGGILILESLEHALKRGAPILGEIIGYGSNSDAYNIVASHPEGKGGSLAMKNALSDAGITTDEVDIISAHATSTKVGDISESIAIQRLFQERTAKIPVVANKSTIGHSQGAAGAMQAIALLKTLEEGIIPPTINVDHLDPEIKLNVVTKQENNKNLNIGISNSFGFGGHCAVIVLKKYQ